MGWGLRSALAEAERGNPLPAFGVPYPTAAGWRVGVEGAPSGALPLHALLPSLLIFLLGDPHLLESALGAGDDRGPQDAPGGGGGSRLPPFHPCRPCLSEPSSCLPTPPNPFSSSDLPKPPSPPSHSEGEYPHSCNSIMTLIHSFNKYLLHICLPWATAGLELGRRAYSQPAPPQPLPQCLLHLSLHQALQTCPVSHIPMKNLSSILTGVLFTLHATPSLNLAP